MACKIHVTTRFSNPSMEETSNGIPNCRLPTQHCAARIGFIVQIIKASHNFQKLETVGYSFLNNSCSTYSPHKLLNNNIAERMSKARLTLKSNSYYGDRQLNFYSIMLLERSWALILKVFNMHSPLAFKILRTKLMKLCFQSFFSKPSFNFFIL